MSYLFATIIITLSSSGLFNTLDGHCDFQVKIVESVEIFPNLAELSQIEKHKDELTDSLVTLTAACPYTFSYFKSSPNNARKLLESMYTIETKGCLLSSDVDSNNKLKRAIARFSKVKSECKESMNDISYEIKKYSNEFDQIKSIFPSAPASKKIIDLLGENVQKFIELTKINELYVSSKVYANIGSKIRWVETNNIPDGSAEITYYLALDNNDEIVSFIQSRQSKLNFRKDEIFKNCLADALTYYSPDKGYKNIVNFSSSDDSFEGDFYRGGQKLTIKCNSNANNLRVDTIIISAEEPNLEQLKSNYILTNFYYELTANKNNADTAETIRKAEAESRRLATEQANDKLRTLRLYCPSPLARLKEHKEQLKILRAAQSITTLDMILSKTDLKENDISSSCSNEWLVIEQKIDEVEKKLSELITTERTPYNFLGFQLGVSSSDVQGRLTGVGRNYNDLSMSFKEFSVLMHESFDFSSFPLSNKLSNKKTKLWLDTQNKIQAVVIDISDTGVDCQSTLSLWFDELKNSGYLEHRYMDFPFRESLGFQPMTVTNLKYAFTGYCDGYKPQVIALKIFRPLKLREIAIEHIIEGLKI